MARGVFRKGRFFVPLYRRFVRLPAAAGEGGVINDVTVTDTISLIDSAVMLLRERNRSQLDSFVVADGSPIQ